MAELKTKPTDESVQEFLDGIADDITRKDCAALVRLMKRITKKQPRMWGTGIVGFGTYHYKYESGREGDWFLTGFSPRKQNITIYTMGGLDRFKTLVERLGKCKAKGSCLYIKRLDDVDQSVLAELIDRSVKNLPGKTN